MAIRRQKRAFPALGMIVAATISLAAPVAPVVAVSAVSGELIQLKGAGSSTPYDVLEEQIEHISCQGGGGTNCTSQLLFVTEVPNNPAAADGRRRPGSKITYTLTIINGGVDADENINLGTLPRNGVVCSDTDFVDFSGDYTPTSPVFLGNLFAGMVVLDRLEPNAVASLSFTCQVK